MEYYVSGVKADAEGNCEICDDAEANFWTLYEQSDSGESQAIVDSKRRAEVEVVMSVYQERDALQQQVNALTAEVQGMKSVVLFISDEDYETSPVEVQKAMGEIANFRTPATDAIKRQWMAEGAIAVRDAIVLAEDGSNLYKTCTDVGTQLRAGEQGGDHA